MRNRPERKKAQLEIMERRAQWVVLEWARQPLATPGEMQRQVRRRFNCGLFAAKKAHARAVQIRNEQFQSMDLSWFVTQYQDLLDQAKSAKKYNAARLILDSMAEKTGIGAPKRVAFGITGIPGSMPGAATPEQLAHVRILQMTPAQRDNRIRELEAKATGAVIDAVAVEASAAGATDPDVG